MNEHNVISTNSLPKILFIHQTFGAQFEFFGKWLANNGWDVSYLYTNEVSTDIPEGIKSYRYELRRLKKDESILSEPIDFALAGGVAAGKLMYRLRHDIGYMPDIVIAHLGWGVGMMVKQVWPETFYITYNEWYYQNTDWETKKPSMINNLSVLFQNRIRNIAISFEFDTSDANWCPTHFQASRFPPNLREKIHVVHDGVNTEFYKPDPEAKLDLEWINLTHAKHILTYATRGMEPLRGFPQFMRGLQVLQKRRNDFDTVILANESISYGTQLEDGTSWWLKSIQELDIDQSKLHVFPVQEREDYLRVLQTSSAHIYFTEPFVTSWSLTEAMATGCYVIGSNTEPVCEMIEDEENGILVDMDDPEEIADMIERAFDRPDLSRPIREKARQSIIDHYDSEMIFRQKSDLLLHLIGQV